MCRNEKKNHITLKGTYAILQKCSLDQVYEQFAFFVTKGVKTDSVVGSIVEIYKREVQKFKLANFSPIQKLHWFDDIHVCNKLKRPN